MAVCADMHYLLTQGPAYESDRCHMYKIASQLKMLLELNSTRVFLATGWSYWWYRVYNHVDVLEGSW